MEKKSASFRLTETARRLLYLLARKLGISKTGVVEIAIRRMAKGEGVIEKEDSDGDS